MKCIYPGCERERVSRGLCNSHYNLATKLVKKGETSWEKMEAAGKCLKLTGPPRQKRTRSAWFLEGATDGATGAGVQGESRKFEPVALPGNGEQAF